MKLNSLETAWSDFMREWGWTIPLLVAISIFVGFVFLVRAIRKGLHNAKYNKKARWRKREANILDSIESYLVKKYGCTPQESSDGHKACYRDLKSGAQLFVTWHPAGKYATGSDLQSGGIRTVVIGTDAISMTVSLLTATRGTVWSESFIWGAINRGSWNGRPKGLYSKPIDKNIRKALSITK